jgi:hypothetical protein
MILEQDTVKKIALQEIHPNSKVSKTGTASRNLGSTPTMNQRANRQTPA